MSQKKKKGKLHNYRILGDNLNFWGIAQIRFEKYVIGFGVRGSPKILNEINYCTNFWEVICLFKKISKKKCMNHLFKKLFLLKIDFLLFFFYYFYYYIHVKVLFFLLFKYKSIRDDVAYLWITFFCVFFLF